MGDTISNNNKSSAAFIYTGSIGKEFGLETFAISHFDDFWENHSSKIELQGKSNGKQPNNTSRKKYFVD